MKSWTPLRKGLVVAVILLVGGLTLQSHWSQAADPEEEVAESTMVLVAGQYVPAATVLRPSMVQPRAYPKGFVPPGALHSLKDLEDNGLGRFAAAVAIPEGQPVTRAILSELKAHHGMAALLAPGHVAVAFAVDSVRGAGGWIQPGDSIAIYSGGEMRVPTRIDGARLLFSSVRVLAVDGRRLGQATKSSSDAQPSESGETVLTVGLNPLEAERLLSARENGRLSVLLRALGDDLPWPERTDARHG